MAFCTNCGTGNQDAAQFCTGCGATLQAAGQISPPTSVPAIPQPTQVIPGGWPYASWGDRVAGYLIDSILVALAMVFLYAIAGAFFSMIAGLGSGVGGTMCCLMVVMFPVASLLVGLYNRIYLVSTRGYSIGQGIMKLKVVDSSGNLLTMSTAAIRLLAQVGLGFVPFVGPLLDLCWPLWDERRQTLHDKAVGSYVLKQG